MPYRKALGGAVALACLIPSTAVAGPFPLRMHSHGWRVHTLQVRLSRVGFATSADGAFGPATRRSVRSYERRESLRADGRVPRWELRRISRDARATGDAPAQEVPGDEAVISSDGRTAMAPSNAPQAVKDAIAAGNRIVDKPYRYGGGHGTWEDSGYDCSGSVSYLLHGAHRLRRPMASGDLESYGAAGHGAWITVYANSGHAYAVVAGLRFDTSGPGESGPRWRDTGRSARGYVRRHPGGL